MSDIKYVKLKCDMCDTYLGYFPIKVSSTDKSEISKITIAGNIKPILCIQCIDLWECIDPGE